MYRIGFGFSPPSESHENRIPPCVSAPADVRLYSPCNLCRVEARKSHDYVIAVGLAHGQSSDLGRAICPSPFFFACTETQSCTDYSRCKWLATGKCYAALQHRCLEVIKAIGMSTKDLMPNRQKEIVTVRDRNGSTALATPPGCKLIHEKLYAISAQSLMVICFPALLITSESLASVPSNPTIASLFPLIQ